MRDQKEKNRELVKKLREFIEEDEDIHIVSFLCGRIIGYNEAINDIRG